MRELLSALAYLHAERKIHRDVKAGNILVAADGSVKLADFGVTGQLTDSIDKRQTKIGTPFWMAPEVISQSAYDGCADVWSAGITAIELCKGAPPYANRIHPFQAILLIPKNPPPVLDGAFSDQFKDFVASCLVKDPAARPSASALLRHPFITGVTGVPPAWKTFIHQKVEELRIKSASMSADESLGDGHLNAMDTSGNGDWNFTSRTNTGLSGPNSRCHSRSNSQLGGFSQAPEGMTPCVSGADSFSRSNPVSAAPSMASRSHSRSGDLSFATGHVSVSKLRLDGLRSTSSEIAERGPNGEEEELVLSDAEVTPNSGRGKMSAFFGPGLEVPGVGEGISFPSTYPSKARHLPIPPGKHISPDTAGAKSAAARSLLESPGNSLSPRSSLGAPPRPKSLTLAHDPNPLSLRSASMEWGSVPGELQRTVSKQEERICTLLEELQALRMENSLLKTISGPYLHALELLAKHREEAAALEQAQVHAHSHAAPTSGTALASMDSFQSISASIQQIVYADDGDLEAQQRQSDQLLNLVSRLTATVPTKASPSAKSIMAPVLQHLRHRVHTNSTSTQNGSTSSSRRSSERERVESVNNILNVLTVALGALDTTDPSNPLRKAQQAARVIAAAEKEKQKQEEIDLTAATPKAVHHSSPYSDGSSAHSTPVMAYAESELEVSGGIEGVTSVDLLTLLTAYLEEDLQAAR
eukprot:CAMPEP_0185012262 /NCGR_PEP_ID=MMETSP1098-20130426/98211_1 /TAXON_ID=89044 /ORGANISM="Spumella elongata, Strain CCAP 955/1" /LENGTH=699 /DNA_ID=CAMNT_0027541317 /DNA_START=430 /DNA_END=2529 /DNA_ORIENTATION=-